MKYNVKWIINGELIQDADSKEEAEKSVKKKLENFINENKNAFEKVGASAIQGSGYLME